MEQILTVLIKIRDQYVDHYIYTNHPLTCHLMEGILRAVPEGVAKVGNINNANVLDFKLSKLDETHTFAKLLVKIHDGRLDTGHLKQLQEYLMELAESNTLAENASVDPAEISVRVASKCVCMIFKIWNCINNTTSIMHSENLF